MRKNPFASDAGLLTEEELLYIESEIVESVYYQTRARDLFFVKNIGQGGGVQVHRHYDEELPSEAQISMTGKAQTDDHPELTAHDINVPVISKEFFLNWRDIASSRRMGESLINASIRTCTRRIAEAEDRLLISGEYTGWAAEGLEGLFGATGRTNTVSVGNWPANAITDINAARAALDTAGFVGMAPTMVGPPALIRCLDAFIANTATTYKQAFLDAGLVSEFVATPNAFAQDGGVDSVVLVMPGKGNFYAVQDLPLEVNIWYDKVKNVYGTVRETIAPVINHADSIAEVNTIVCA